MLDPRCCQALSSSLQLLNIAYTQTQDLSGAYSETPTEVNSLLGLELMSRLYSLDASGNLISSLPQVGGWPSMTPYPHSQVVSLVSHLSMLVSIDLRENKQLVKLPMYRTRVIVAGRGLQHVDGRPVDATTRLE